MNLLAHAKKESLKVKYFLTELHNKQKLKNALGQKLTKEEIIQLVKLKKTEKFYKGFIQEIEKKLIEILTEFFKNVNLDKIKVALGLNNEFSDDDVRKIIL